MDKVKAITLVESVVERNTKNLPVCRYARLAGFLYQLKTCVNMDQFITVLLFYKNFLVRSCGLSDSTYNAIITNVRAC